MKFIYLSMIILLSGCAAAALPPVVSYVSYLKTAADVGSYVVTEKTTTDHILSAVTEKDCKLFRILVDKKICIEYKKDKQTKTKIATEYREIPTEIPVIKSRPNVIIDYSVLDNLKLNDHIKKNVISK